MARTATDGPKIDDLRAEAFKLFPGKSAVICKLNKEQVQTAIQTRTLPDVTSAPRPAQLPNIGANDAAQAIATAIESLTANYQRPVSEDEVRLIARDVFCSLMEDAPRKELSIRVNDLPRVDVNAQHKTFPVLLAVCTARVNVMMVGPAGSGKTSAAHEVANVLGLQFRAQSVGPQTSKSDLLGYMDAGGTYRSTPLREMYQNGGVYLLDELDAGNPGVLTVLNALLANGEMIFGDGVPVKKHADFCCIAAANTYGTGASREYVGRQQLDAATLDRFFILNWDYDESFEAALLGLKVTRNYAQLRPSGYTPETWFARVTAIRRSVESAKVRHLISPRATLSGAKLLELLPRELLEEGLIWKGLPAIQRQQIEAGVK